MLKMGQEKERKRSKEKIWTASEKVRGNGTRTRGAREQQKEGKGE